jgi:hypothetical protein
MSFAEDQHPVGHFVRVVSTNCSAWAFARGLRGAIFTASMPASASGAGL